MSNLTLEFILSLVDRLSGPAREARESLEEFDAAARKAVGADAGLSPQKWVDESRAIGTATDAVKTFEKSTLQATETEEKLGAPWIATTEDIDKATAALKGFAEQMDVIAAKKLKPGAPGAPGDGGHGESSGVWRFVENAAEMLAIFEGPKAVEGIVGGGAHLTSEVIAQRIAGMTQAQIDEARAISLDLEQQFPQFPLTEILKEAREARAIFNTDEEAREALPDYLRMAALADRDHPGEGLHAAYPFLRAVEEAGAANTPGKAHEMFEAFQRAKNAFGAKISADDYQQVFQRGGAFARQWNMTFIRDELPHLLASLGGDATGTMVATLGMAIQGGHVMGPSLRAFDDLGLLDEKKVHRKKNGDVSSIDPGAIKGIDIISKDPVQWVNDILWPAIQKKTQDPAQQDALLAVALSNRNDLKAGYMAINDKASFQRDANLVESPENKGLGASDLLANDPTVGWQKLKSSIESLASVASEPLMEPLAAMLDKLAGALSHLTKEAADHPMLGAAGATGVGAAITYLTGKAFSMIPKWLGAGGSGAAKAAAAEAPEAAGALGALGQGLRALAAANPFGALASIASWTTPEEDKILADAISRENREAAQRGDRGRGSPSPSTVMRGSTNSRGTLGYLDRPDLQGVGNEVAPKVDTKPIEAASTKAKQAGEDLKALGATVSPKIDTASIDALIAKLREAAALVGSINGGLAGTARHASSAGALHDGPETH